MTERLVEVLYFLSSGLLAPTLVLLLAFLASSLFMLGGLAREALDRRLSSWPWRRFLADLRSGKSVVEGFGRLRLVGYPARFQHQSRNLDEHPQLVKKLLEDLELDIARRLAWLSFKTRLGPMLGLVGTLVPLGPALTGLAAGDIQTLSGNLVIAFTTTVFGILIGGFAYAAALVRRSWYEQDLSDLEFVAGCWAAAEPRRNPPHNSQNGHGVLLSPLADVPLTESPHAP